MLQINDHDIPSIPLNLKNQMDELTSKEYFNNPLFKDILWDEQRHSKEVKSVNECEDFDFKVRCEDMGYESIYSLERTYHFWNIRLQVFSSEIGATIVANPNPDNLIDSDFEVLAYQKHFIERSKSLIQEMNATNENSLDYTIQRELLFKLQDYIQWNVITSNWLYNKSLTI